MPRRQTSLYMLDEKGAVHSELELVDRDATIGMKGCIAGDFHLFALHPSAALLQREVAAVERIFPEGVSRTDLQIVGGCFRFHGGDCTTPDLRVSPSEHRHEVRRIEGNTLGIFEALVVPTEFLGDMAKRTMPQASLDLAVWLHGDLSPARIDADKVGPLIRHFELLSLPIGLGGPGEV